MTNTFSTKFEQLKQLEPLSLLKIVVVLYIIVSTVSDFNKHLIFLDQKIIKIFILFAILFVLYYNLHLGILFIIAFLIILIQLNGNTITQINSRKLELFMASLPDSTEHIMSTTNTNQQTVECDNKQKNELSEEILDYSLDPKVKPYEVFVKMLTTAEHLENASNSAHLE